MEDNFMQNVMNAINGKESETNVMVATAEPMVWDGIAGCQSFSTPVTISEAAEAVGANYEVKKRHMVAISDKLYKAIMDGTPITETTLRKTDIVTSHRVTYREDNGTILGVVGSNYGVVQNADSLAWFNTILNGSLTSTDEKPVIETAGILDNGGRFYITAKMPNPISIEGDNSPITDYILLTNSHDGSGSVQAFFTPIRVICRNTLAAAIEGAQNKVLYKHTSRVNERMDLANEVNFQRASEVLKFHETYKKAFIEDINHLRSIKVNQEQAMDLVCRIFADDTEMNALRNAHYNVDTIDTEVLSTRKKNLITSMMDEMESGIGQDSNRGTGYWMYNAATTWAQNGRAYKDPQQKFDSIIGGDMSRKVQKMHDMVLELV